ncbi:MAG: Zn-dependent hydrolase [Gemmatimonadota bacterium]|jgi:N-carbamoyl-L-amino-acid hydrolase
MNRRHFTRLAGASVAGLALPTSLRVGAARAFAPSPQEPRVDGARLNQRLAELARFGANPQGGVSRVAFSDADLKARAWVSDLMRGAGLDVSVDVAGNLWGRRGGSDPELKPLVLGSHIDSVPEGGNYDGQVGSMAAVEAAWTLADHDLPTRHPLHFVIFTNEEGGKTGSRALAGEVEPAELEIVTASGYTIGEGLRRVGGNPDRLGEAARPYGSVEAFLELHVEQGALLDTDGQDIGVVEGIVGIMRWNVTVEGRANHAGTTPMDRRRDAMVGAARFVDTVYTTVRSISGTQVATVGRIAAEPGAPNVIPGRVTLSLEIRDLAMEKIESVFGRLEERAEAIGRDTGTTFSFERFYVSEAAPTDPRIRDVVENTAQELGLSTRRMPSGAGHDAQSMAHLGPVGMIFIPSVDGISHAPEEFTEPEDVTRGADVLLGTLLALDAGALDK